MGLFNVKMRSLACLIRTFLETATNPNFRHSLYHVLLYRYHVLGETSLPNPGVPPFYDENFFATIRHFHETSPLNIAVMTIKQWYSVLIEDRVLISPATENNPQLLLSVRAEILSPTTDLRNSWRLLRIKGVESKLSAFLFKLLHRLLATQDRVSRLRGEDGICIVCHVDTEYLNHAFFTCPQSRVAGLALLCWVQVLCPNLQPEDVLELRLGEALPDVDELAAVYTIATGLFYIWESRKLKKQITHFLVRAVLEAKTPYSEELGTVRQAIE